jgi:hypothetical protein
MKRAEIVKKVMMEKGLKMIEASKYVKANNLYTPKSKAEPKKRGRKPKSAMM